MFSQKETNKSINGCLDDIQRAVMLINDADSVIVGVGSGLSAAGGLNYVDPALTEKWYPEYYAMGLKSIIEIMANYWPNTVSQQPERFWGFWAKHIYHIRYEPEATKPYRDLFNLIGNKEHFIVSTNVDGQLEKAGFQKDKIFAPQGDYALFQCQRHCCDKVYDNRETIETMLYNMPNALEICTEGIPKCSCGDYLIPNLRCDELFVEAPHVQNMDDYSQFINSRYQQKLVFLELGVGFNTPGIIRLPFEQMTKVLPNATLIRINNTDIRTIEKISDKSIGIKYDLSDTLHEMVNGTPS